MNNNPTATLNTRSTPPTQLIPEWPRSITTSTTSTPSTACTSSAPGRGLLADNNLLQLNPSQLTIQYARAQVFAGNWTWTPNSTWVNEARVGYSHYYQTFLSNDSQRIPPTIRSMAPPTTSSPARPTRPTSGSRKYASAATPIFRSGASWPKTVGPDGVLQIVGSRFLPARQARL